MNLPNSPNTRRSSKRSGFTMVDIALASVILVVAIGGLASTVISTIRLTRTNEESADAYEAARAVTESVSALASEQVFDFYTANPNFQVIGLDPIAGDADGFVGQILFPTIGGELREDVVDASQGMPRDLNGDGAIDALDHSDDYILLPMTIRMQWSGVSGARTEDLTILVAGS